MADGEINRNGATIRIDDDGGVQVEPADGQEVEYTGPDRGTDAIRDSVNTAQQLTEPSGARLTKDSTQSAGDDTLLDPVSWEIAEEFNSVADDFADLSSDGVTIPNDKYSYARVRCQIRMDSPVTFDLLELRLNDGPVGGRFDLGGVEAGRLGAVSGWIAVESGDTFTIRFRQESGDVVDIEDSISTWFEVEAV